MALTAFDILAITAATVTSLCNMPHVISSFNPSHKRLQTHILSWFVLLLGLLLWVIYNSCSYCQSKRDGTDTKLSCILISSNLLSTVLVIIILVVLINRYRKLGNIYY